jgi:hypothetical protein
VNRCIEINKSKGKNRPGGKAGTGSRLARSHDKILGDGSFCFGVDDRDFGLRILGRFSQQIL